MNNKEAISNIIYETLDYMYCDNCRSAFEIDENDKKWGCEFCYRKYNGWGISRAVSDALAEKIMRVGDE